MPGTAQNRKLTGGSWKSYVKNGDQYLLSTYNKKGVSAVPVPATPKLNSMTYPEPGSEQFQPANHLLQKRGKNIFIDAHGWCNQTITRYKSTGEVYKAFKKYFPGTRPATFGKGLGYISGYASSIGYEAALFESPAVSSDSQFTKKGYAGKFINSVFYMVKNIK